MVSVTAISDLHYHLPDDLPGGDLLIIAGDNVRASHDQAYEAVWLRTKFSDWLNSLPYDNIIGIAGNHDFVLEDHPEVAYDMPWTYLDHSSADACGLKVFGSPWTPYFYGWAFNGPDDPGEQEKFFEDKWGDIPEDTDIVVTHGPPHGVLDRCQDGRKGGCPLLKRHVYSRVKPMLHVFGHIHEAYGKEDVNGVAAANVSYVNCKYQPNGKPYHTFEFTPND